LPDLTGDHRVQLPIRYTTRKLKTQVRLPAALPDFHKFTAVVGIGYDLPDKKSRTRYSHPEAGMGNSGIFPMASDRSLAESIH
jgi:hypothetical protein